MIEKPFWYSNDAIDLYLMRSNNRTSLTGIVEEIKLDQGKFWEDQYYTMKISVVRTNGKVDTIPVIIPKSLAQSIDLNLEGKFVRVIGQIRSYDLHTVLETGEDKHKLLVFLLAFSVEEISLQSNEIYENYACLQGVICKMPHLKILSDGRKIIEFFLLVEGKHNARNYIPCIAWNARADYISKNAKVSDSLEIKGKFQSRKYLIKGTENLADTYEVAILNFNITS